MGTHVCKIKLRLFYVFFSLSFSFVSTECVKKKIRSIDALMHSGENENGVVEFLKTALPILFNMTTLVSVGWAFKRRLPFESMVLVNAFLWGMLYHMCDGLNLCALKFGTLLLFDQFFATYVFSVLATYAMDIKDGRMRTVMNIMFGELVLLVLLAEGYQIVMFCVLLVATFMTTCLLWFARGISVHHDWVDVYASISLFGTSVVLFTFTSSTSYTHWLYHSLWHACVMLNAYLFLEIKTRKRRLTTPQLNPEERNSMVEHGIVMRSAMMGVQLQDMRDAGQQQCRQKYPQDDVVRAAKPTTESLQTISERTRILYCQQQQQLPPHQQQCNHKPQLQFIPLVEFDTLYPETNQSKPEST